MNEELPDEQAPETPPEVVPETQPASEQEEPQVEPQPDPLPAPEPAAPPSDDWVSVRWTMPLYGDSPIAAAGKWWHPGTEHTLTRLEAELLGTDFSIIGPADAPPKGG